jgi:aspartyl-tRNA(Asn)/glutamyl-tRNA(Gln) amidotransferase subunit C
VSEPLTRDGVAEVAKLAMLELTDDDVPPTNHPYPLVNIFRSDVVEPTDDITREVLAAAPEAEDDQFRVPPALGEEM